MALAAALALRVGPPPETVDPGPLLAFIHVESNVDGASLGHSAFRVGSDVYHFQQAPHAQRVLLREDWTGFRFVYTERKNRSLHLVYLDVAPPVRSRIALQFARAYVREQTARALLRDGGEDLAWWQALADGVVPPPLPFAGLLEIGASRHGGTGDPALRERVGRLGGGGDRERRRSELQTFVEEFTLADDAADGDDAGRLRQLREALRERLALDALRFGYRAAEAVCLDVDPRPLTGAERQSLEAFRSALEDRVVALLGSSRPDRGGALLLALARHDVVARSLAVNRLVLLDGFSDAGESERPISAGERSAFAALAVRASEVLAEVRARVLQGDGVRESDYNLLEEAASRVQAMRAGARGDAVRVQQGRLVPARSAVIPVALEGRVDAHGLPEARARFAAQQARLEDRHRYDLWRGNCATELLRVLNAACPEPEVAVRELGARLDPEASLRFVPFVMHADVTARLSVSGTEIVLSRRQRELQRLQKEDPSPLVPLREAATVSSTLYSPRLEDGAFLLFTDDVFWPRPLFGAVNFCFGLSSALVGVVWTPFDGGKLAGAGLHGAAYSLPELLFCNVRKGSYDSGGW